MVRIGDRSSTVLVNRRAVEQVCRAAVVLVKVEQASRCGERDRFEVINPGQGEEVADRGGYFPC